MKCIYFALLLSAVFVFSACAKKDDSSSSSSSTSSTSSSSTYTRSSTPSSMSVSVPTGVSASTINTSSRTSDGRSAEAYASSGPCQDVTQTGESSIANNKVAVGCEKLANATGETKNKILSILALAKINSALTRDPSIGREKQIGHTFLLELRDSPGNFVKIWKHDIFPLLEEYYFEAPNVITEMFNNDIFESQEGIKNFEEGTLSKALEYYITPIQTAGGETVGDETSDSELGND